jgi:maleate cis-trans isomerase
VSAAAETATIRIGVLVPAGNTVHEHEFAMLRPPGVEFAFRGFAQPGADAGGWCAELLDRMSAPIAELREWGASVLLVGCTAASMRCADPASRAELGRRAGVPVVTAAGASRAALAALGARSVAVATPYGPASNAVVTRYMRSAGIDVAAIEGLGYDASPELWKQGTASLVPARLLDYALSIDVPRADAMYFPCTGVASIEAIARYEARTGKRATSSVQAGFWAALHCAGVDGRQAGYGQLLAQWPDIGVA